MAQADLLARLESVTNRLEKLASSMGKGGSGGEGGGGDEIPPYVAAYQAIVDNQVKNAVKAINDLGIPDVGTWLQQGFDNINVLIKATASCKKPANPDLMAFLKAGVDAINQSDNARFKGKDFKNWGDHYKTVYETINSISWVTMAAPMGTPKSHVEAQEQATDFNALRVTKAKKDEKTKAFIDSLKALNKVQKEFVNEYFKIQLEWNPKGGELKAYDPKSASASKAASVSKEEEKDEKKGGQAMGNISAVFGELSQGLNVTKGLKKVKDEDKAKNRKDRSGKVEMKEPEKKAKKEKPPCRIEYVGGRWLVENYNEGLQLVEKADMKSNIFITNCDDTTIQVKGKIKSVTVDKCTKCRVYIEEVVSTIEVINCSSVTLYIQTKAPSISIEKSTSPRIVLSKSAYEAHPDIITSNISAMNIEIPGKGDGDDNVELAVPEQFITKIDPKNGKISTCEVSHGG